MNYIKVSIKEELPKSGLFVTAIDIEGNQRVYCHNNDDTWTMRDADGINSPNNNLQITDWLKPSFSEDEIRWLKKNYWIGFGVSKTEYTRKSSHDDGSDSYLLRLEDDGGLYYWSMIPVNIDCDTAKSDTEIIIRKYKTFDDFKNNNPYLENIKVR